MKPVLIITSQGSKSIGWEERSQYIETFCQALNDQLGQIEIEFTTYTDILAKISQDKISFIDLKSGRDLKDFAFVQFKNWHGNLEYASTIARYLRDNNVPFANPEVAIDINIGKISQAYVFAKSGLPTPYTVFLMVDRLRNFDESDLERYGLRLPLIMKQVDGSRGDNNFLIRDIGQIAEAIALHDDELPSRRPHYVLQEFIPNDGDYRVLFIGTQQEPFVFMRKADGDSHLNNTSKGGSGGLVNVSDLPEAYIQDAKRAAQAVNLEIVGVDIIVDSKTGQHFVLETNSTPAIATGFMVAEKTKKFGDYISSLVDNEAVDD